MEILGLIAVVLISVYCVRRMVVTLENRVKTLEAFIERMER